MQRQSKEERQRQRALEEARKAGIVAPETDEEGKPINPHIPQFMASAPWYLNQDQPTLKHQKNWKGAGPAGASKQAWYARGSELKGFQATKYRKGGVHELRVDVPQGKGLHGAAPGKGCQVYEQEHRRG